MADDAAGAVRRTPRPAVEDTPLIEQAAEVLHRESLQGGGSARGARALAAAGLLADPGYMPWGRTVDEGVQGALRHLSTKASTAGKRRTAEWLAECAELVMEPGSPSWPPAPAYKGPMVPAAELDALQAHIDAALAVLDLPWPDDEDHHDFVNGQVEAARATLRAAQPTGEADRG